MQPRSKRDKSTTGASDKGSTQAKPCPHYPRCFGCPFIAIPYPEQLVRKRRALIEALANYPALSRLEIPPVIPSPHRLGYRARAKLVVGERKSEIIMGLYVPQSHRISDISSCPVHPLPMKRVLHYLKSQVPRLEILPYDETRDSGQLRYIDMLYSFWTQKLMITLVTRHEEFPQGRELARALMRRFPFVEGVVQNIHDVRENVIWGERSRDIAGRNTIVERVSALKLRFSSGVFSQANPAMASKLYETVVAMAQLSGHRTVLDLYCGVGPIALSLARVSHVVWGYDENPLAISTAKQNARMNGIGNCRFFSGDVAEKLGEVEQTLSEIDLVVLNPPRKGIRQDALEAILSLHPPRMIYVSCDPRTLARDMDRLAIHGYRPLTIKPFDMFPQTEEVETVALLECGSSSLPREGHTSRNISVRIR